MISLGEVTISLPWPHGLGTLASWVRYIGIMVDGGIILTMGEVRISHSFTLASWDKFIVILIMVEVRQDQSFILTSWLGTLATCCYCSYHGLG